MNPPPLILVNHKDIQIFTGQNALFANNPFCLEILLYLVDIFHWLLLVLDCSSLEGERLIDDVFGILDDVVVVGSSNAFVLQGIDDRGLFLPTTYQRGSPGTFNPGRYIIGKLNSICFLVLVLMIFQSLRKLEWRFSEEIWPRLRLAWEKCRVWRVQKSVTQQLSGQRYWQGCDFYILSTDS